MGLLTDLYDIIAIPLVSEWFCVREICLLDSACCKQLDRERFHKWTTHTLAVFQQEPGSLASESYILWLSLHKYRVTSLIFSGNVVQSVNSKCKRSVLQNLKSLTIQHQVNQTNYFWGRLEPILYASSNLLSIELLNSFVLFTLLDVFDLLAANCKKLQVCRITFVNRKRHEFHLCRVSFEKFAKSCSELTIFDLKQVSCFCFDDYLSLLATNCKHLEEIRMDIVQFEYNLEIGLLSVAADLSMLRILELKYKLCVSHIMVEKLGIGCPLLTHLHLHRTRAFVSYNMLHDDIYNSDDALFRHKLQGDFLSMEHVRSSFTALSSLKSLHLNDPSKVEDEALLVIAEVCCHQLQEISLRGNSVVTETGYMHLTLCVQLTAVDLSDGKQVTDVVVTALCASCQQLSVLKISRCKRLTKKG